MGAGTGMEEWMVPVDVLSSCAHTRVLETVLLQVSHDAGATLQGKDAGLASLDKYGHLPEWRFEFWAIAGAGDGAASGASTVPGCVLCRALLCCSAQ
jgi:hypothetical protein